MIRTWGIALLVGMMLPACMAERVSVAQVESILTQSQSLPDARPGREALRSAIDGAVRAGAGCALARRAARAQGAARVAGAGRPLGVSRPSRRRCSRECRAGRGRAAPHPGDGGHLREQGDPAVAAILRGAHDRALRRLRPVAQGTRRMEGGSLRAVRISQNHRAVPRGAGDRGAGAGKSGQHQERRPGAEDLGRVRAGAGAGAGGRGSEQAGVGALGTGRERAAGSVPVFRSQGQFALRGALLLRGRGVRHGEQLVQRDERLPRGDGDRSGQRRDRQGDTAGGAERRRIPFRAPTWRWNTVRWSWVGKSTFARNTAYRFRWRGPSGRCRTRAGIRGRPWARCRCC